MSSKPDDSVDRSYVQIPELQNEVQQSLPNDSSLQNSLSWPQLAVIVVGVYVSAFILMFFFFSENFAGTKTHFVIDSIYLSVVTFTSVGYGDIVPISPATKIITSFLAFLGIGLIFTLLSTAGSYLLDKQEALIRKQLEDLSHVDLEDDDCSLDILKPDPHVRGHTFRVIMALAAVSFFHLLGIIVLMALEDHNFVDAFYCTSISITTVGYGDIGFTTAYGRLFGIFWLLMSTLTVGWAIGECVDVQLHTRQRETAARILRKQLTQDEFKRNDDDKDGKLRFAEYCIAELKMLERTNSGEIKAIHDVFASLDNDKDGVILAPDLNQPPS